MPQISIVKLSEVEKDGRFDAEFYKPEYLKIKTKLEKINSINLGEELLEITGGATPLGANYPKKGIPFLRVQNIMQNYIDDGDFVYLSEKQDTEIKRSRLKEGDVLLTITGSYGKSAPVTKEFIGANINQHSVRMNFTKKLLPLYISTFLNCYFGKKQSDRNIIGISRPALDYSAIKNFKIPLLPPTFQQKIETIVRDSYSKLKTSKTLYNEAEELLLKELNLENYKPKHELSFSSKLNEVLEAERFDADYFQPKYKEIEKKIEGFENLTLADKESFKIITGVYSQKYSDKGTKYIRSVDIQNNLFVNPDELYKTEEKFENKVKVKEGDIVTSRVGSIGTLGYIHKELDGSFISDNILRIRNLNKNLNSLFLAFYLKKIGTTFMERLSRGSVQQRLNQETLKEIKIPLISKSIQEKISSKIQESFKLRKESKELLEKAKKMVEDEIEREAKKGGDNV